MIKGNYSSVITQVSVFVESNVDVAVTVTVFVAAPAVIVTRPLDVTVAAAVPVVFVTLHVTL